MCTLGKGVKYQKILKVLFKEIIKNEKKIISYDRFKVAEMSIFVSIFAHLFNKNIRHISTQI